MNEVAFPAPLVAAEVDVRSLDWFKLHYKRLIRSAWWKRASHEARSINVDLWCEAFAQVPAASLPDDDFELAGFAGFGRDVDGWRRVRADVLAPWLLCSDGRLYHPTLAEVALEAFDSQEGRRKREREKKARQRAKAADPDGHDIVSPGDNPPRPQETTPRVPRAKSADKIRGEEIRSEGQSLTLGDAPSTVGEAKAPAPVKEKAKRGTRIPFGWTPSKADREYAVGQGFTEGEAWSIGDDFYLFWTAKAGQGATKMDWSATWKTWIRTEAKRRGGRNGSGSYNSTGPRAPDAGRERLEDRDRAMLGGLLAAVDRARGVAGQSPPDSDQPDPSHDGPEGPRGDRGSRP